MAGDWIKMRADIARDPRVIAIADALAESRPFMDWLTAPFGPPAACRESAYERVTRCVTVSVTVTALVRVWSLARTQGRSRGDDVLLDCATLPTLDVIAEVPDFGYAMASVGWVVERPDGAGLVFPKFLRQNTTPEDRKREQAAERVRRKRERDKGVTPSVTGCVTPSVTGNADVTHRVEESREEKNKKAGPLTPAAGSVTTDPPPAGYDPLREDERRCKEFVARWNAAGLRPLDRLNHTLRSFLLACLNDPDWAEQYPAALTRAGANPFFLPGTTRKSGPLDPYEFLKEPDWVRQILAGRHDQKPPTADPQADRIAKAKAGAERATELRKAQGCTPTGTTHGPTTTPPRPGAVPS